MHIYIFQYMVLFGNSCHSERPLTSFRRKPALQRAERPSAKPLNHDLQDWEGLEGLVGWLFGVSALMGRRGIPRSHRYARSRPLALKRRGHTYFPLRIHGLSFRAQRGISPFTKRKGAMGMPCHLWMGVSRNAPTVDSGFRRNDVRGAGVLFNGQILLVVVHGHAVS